MARKSQKVPFTAAEIAAIARSNAYVQRLVEDAKLRSNVRSAADSLRKVYDRLSNGNVSAVSLLEDKKTQSELGKAFENLRDATLALTVAPRRRRRLRPGRLLVLAGVGGGVALATSEKLRSKVLDLLFGAEEEFQYTPPPSTAPPAPGMGATPDSPADTAAATGTQTGSAPGAA